MNKKSTGLAAFSRKTVPDVSVGNTQTIDRPRGRGKGDVVALTVRLPRGEWERLHQLAVAEGVSLQALAVDGFSKVFKEKGLPPLSI